MNEYSHLLYTFIIFIYIYIYIYIIYTNDQVIASIVTCTVRKLVTCAYCG